MDQYKVTIHVFGATVDAGSLEIDTNEVRKKKWMKKEEVISMLKNNQTHCGVSMLSLLYAIQFYL